MHFDEITEDEWRLLAPILADAPNPNRQRGRPRAQVRVVANAVLWILTTGESWSSLPGRYPSVPTCRNRFEAWRSSGALAEMYRILWNAGRRFRCDPQLLPVRQPASLRSLDRPNRDKDLRKVIWKDQASWQAPRDTQQPPSTVETFTRIARHVPEPARAVPVRVESRAPVTSIHSIHRTAAPWMGLASRGHRVFDPRGYVIYIAADLLPNDQFRGWAEIARDAQRVARSGLIGPSFKSCETAQQFALEWARRWIDEDSGEIRDDDAHEAEIDVLEQKLRSG